MKKKLLLSSIVFSLTLTACTTTSDEDQKSYKQTESSKIIKKSYDTITIGNGTDPETLDPHKMAGIVETNILNQILEGLTTLDNNGKTIPGIAKAWNSSDNKNWIFYIREAKWSNGEDITADDFVYSFRRLADPKTASPYASYLADMHIKNADKIIAGEEKLENLGIKALNYKTLEINLDTPVPYLPEMLAHTSVNPVFKKAIETHGDKWTQPENFVANGPYNISEWKINDQIVLTRSSNYYDDANTKINKVILLPITSQTAELNRFEAGELDVTNNDLPSSQIASIKKNHEKELKTSPSLCTYYYEFNLNKPPFNDVKVRRAISLITDRETFANKIAAQGQIPAYQFTPTAAANVEAYEPSWKNQSQQEKIEQAKKLLAEAGYSESNPLKFELLYNTNIFHKKYAIAISAIWKQAIPFVNAELNNQEWRVYLDNRKNKKIDMARAVWCADYNDQSSFLNALISKSSNNYAKYNNPKFDEIIETSLKTGLTAKQRAQIYKQAEEVIDQDVAQINMYYYTDARLVSERVTGYSTRNPLNGYRVKYWSLSDNK